MRNFSQSARHDQDDARKYQFIFMAIGVAIIAGGILAVQISRQRKA